MNRVELYQKIELQPEIIQKLDALGKEIKKIDKTFFFIFFSFSFP